MWEKLFIHLVVVNMLLVLIVDSETKTEFVQVQKNARISTEESERVEGACMHGSC